LYCIVLYCIVLYCIVLFCIVLYCIVLYCIVLYCIVLYCIVLYCIVGYRGQTRNSTNSETLLMKGLCSKCQENLLSVDIEWIPTNFTHGFRSCFVVSKYSAKMRKTMEHLTNILTLSTVYMHVLVCLCCFWNSCLPWISEAPGSLWALTTWLTIVERNKCLHGEHGELWSIFLALQIL
jgi:hypothetical protein